MANDLSRRPWSLDTAAVIDANFVRVKSLRWVGSTTAGHVVRVEDANGERIWESAANGANFVDGQDFGIRGQNFEGFEVATIDSGILYVTLA